MVSQEFQGEFIRENVVENYIKSFFVKNGFGTCNSCDVFHTDIFTN
jgi:hypothetical protein